MRIRAWIVVLAVSLLSVDASAADQTCLTQSHTDPAMWWPRGSPVYYEFAANIGPTQRNEIVSALTIWSYMNSANNSGVVFQPRTAGQYPRLLFNNSAESSPIDAIEQVFRHTTSDVEIRFYPTGYYYNGTPGFYKKVALHAIGHTMGLADQSVAHIPANAQLSVMNIPNQPGDADNFMATGPTPCDMNTLNSRLYPSNDFGLSAPSLTIDRGGQLTTSAQTWVTRGSGTTVNLSVGAGSGITATVNPSTTYTGAASSLTLRVSTTAPVGTRPLTLYGTSSDGVTRSYRFTVTIPEPPPPPPEEDPPGGCDLHALTPHVDDCQPRPGSPIVLDLAGNGYSLTSAEAGVRFDLFADGHRPRVAWTAPNSDDAWLALDRDGDGTIDSGAELFGDATPQPASSAPNGFEALAVYDELAAGGDGDGWISISDAVYASLRLWRDANHDGISQPAELEPLDRHVAAIRIAYDRVRIFDDHGNELRYRSVLRPAAGARVARTLYDVWLVVAD